MANNEDVNKTDEAVKETAWMYCRECALYDTGETDDAPCGGAPWDYEITDANPPCAGYVYGKGGHTARIE